VNYSEFGHMITNARLMSLKDIGSASLEDLIRNSRMSVKSKTSLSTNDQTDIAAKIKQHCEKDSELASWYECAQSFVGHFEAQL